MVTGSNPVRLTNFAKDETITFVIKLILLIITSFALVLYGYTLGRHQYTAFESILSTTDYVLTRKIIISSLFQKLSEGGSVMMPLDNYGFSKKFGWVSDKYGVSWQLNLA